MYHEGLAAVVLLNSRWEPTMSEFATQNSNDRTFDLVPDLGSSDRYRATLSSVGESAFAISGEARAIGETIDALNRAFAGLTGEGGSDTFGGFGLLGLPIMATWAAIKKTAEQYVGHQTGQSLSEWMAFVDAASDQFNRYVATLDSLQAFTGSRADAPTDALDATVRADLQKFDDVRHATQAWKVILNQVAKIGQLVDAFLAARDNAASDDVAKSSEGRPWAKIQDRVSEAVTQGSLGSVDFREWLFKPLVDLNDQVQALPSAIDRISDEVSLLEVKLELAATQLNALAGEITDDEVRIVQLRVAGSVLLPGLISQINTAEAILTKARQHAERLDELSTGGEITQDIYERLRARYTDDVDAAADKVTRLRADLKAWQTDGPAAVAGGTAWLDDRIKLIEGREMVEGGDQFAGRLALLNAERRQLARIAGYLEANTS